MNHIRSSLIMFLAVLLTWTLLAAQAPPYQTGWPLSLNTPVLGSPRVADLDGDGKAEVILPTYALPPKTPYQGGAIHILRHDGTPFSASWPLNTSGPAPAAPAVGDLDRDGNLEIVFGHWGGLGVISPTGAMLPGWPKSTNVSRAPTLADLDGDGDLEVIAVSSQTVNVYHHDGSLYGRSWPNSLSRDTTEVLVLDTDGDGRPEVFAGDWNQSLQGWTPDGAPLTGWTKTLAGAVRVGPVGGDVTGDGKPEIVVGTWNPDQVHVFDAAGNTLPGWPQTVSYGRMSVPTLVDMDRDGDLEIFVGGWSTSNSYVIFGFDHQGKSLPGWPASAPPVIQYTGNINSNGIAVDLDGDTWPELLWKVMDGWLAFHRNGKPVSGFPLVLSDQNHTGTFSPTPALGDLDGDGDLEMVAPSTFDKVAVFDLAGPWDPGVTPWDSFRAGPAGPGGYGRGRTLVADITLLSVVKGGSAGLTLDFGKSNKGSFYALLPSLSGTSPGLQLGSWHLPLVMDPLTYFSLSQATPLMTGFSGSLDSQGQTQAFLNLPAGFLPPAAAGTRVSVAGVVMKGSSVGYTTNPVVITLGQ